MTVYQGQVKVVTESGWETEGYCNGKNYAGFIYIQPAGRRAKSHRLAVEDLASIELAHTTPRQASSPAASALCPRCNTYCDGDCQANA